MVGGHLYVNTLLTRHEKKLENTVAVDKALHTVTCIFSFCVAFKLAAMLTDATRPDGLSCVLCRESCFDDV